MALSLLAMGFATLMYKWLRLKKISRTPPLPPGPTGYPILGCLPQMLMNKPTFRWIHQLMQESNTEIACIRFGLVHVISITSPELARECLKKQDSVFASRPDCMSARVTSNGYLTAIFSPAGVQWKKMRRIMVSEVLSPNTHQWLYQKRCEEADHLVRYIYNQGKNPLRNGDVNVKTVAQHYCGNVIRKLVFNKRFFGGGMEDGGPGVEEEEHVAGIFTIVACAHGFNIADYVPWLESFDVDGHKAKLRNAIKNVTKYHDPEITNRVEMWRNGVRNVEEDILDVLINLKDSKNNRMLTIEEIKAQIIEIMIASVDNPSNAVEWAIAEMINQPGIFERALKELDQVVGLVQESDLPKLNFVKACAREAFRLHPIAPFNVPHTSAEDTIVGGYFIPKGSRVLLSRLGLGRNPRVWEDPLQYKPKRHIINESSEVVLTDPQLCMLSFSNGRRGCPGIVLGSTMTTMLLARLIHGFTWTPPSNGPSYIELTESKEDLFLAKPLIAHAKPRLDADVYLQLQK